MSGICGIINFNSNEPVNKSILIRMCKDMVYRGPDSTGFFVENNLGLGNCYLGPTGFQQADTIVCNEDKNIRLVCDGAIHNAGELRKQLQTSNHQFRSSLDVEVIVHLYETEGIEGIRKLDGIFAFALWDKKKRCLFLVRDHMGIKPLYYGTHNRNLIFCSELKPILEYPGLRDWQIDTEALSEYLTFEYVPGPKTILKKIHKVLPGYRIDWENGKIKSTQYWNFSFSPNVNFFQNKEWVCEQIIKRLTSSIKGNINAFGKVGNFLSGGKDTGSLVCLRSGINEDKISTFSSIFDDIAFSESKDIDLICNYFNTEAHKVLVTSQLVKSKLTNILNSLDEPLADASYLPSCVLAEFIGSKLNVCLSGDGGDELFGGYPVHQAYILAEHYRKFPEFIKRFIKLKVDKMRISSSYRSLEFKAKKFLRGIDYPPAIGYFIWYGAYNHLEKQKLLNEGLREKLHGYDVFRPVNSYLVDCSGYKSNLDKIFYLDLKFNLIDGSLRKTERACIVNSVESRFPYLNPNLVNFSASIPSGLKIKGLRLKHTFRKAIKKYWPPNTPRIYNKRGFDIPLGQWIKGDFKEFVSDTLSEQAIKKEGFFDHKYVKKILNEHFSGQNNHRQLIWPLVVFENWIKSLKNIGKDSR